MTKYKCVLGEIRSKPNELIYITSMSNRKYGTWIGFCNGDDSHPEHFVRIQYKDKYWITGNSTDIFQKRHDSSLVSRLFDDDSKLRCPEGKVYMNLQRKLTNEIGKNNVDIFKCTGNRFWEGHKEHLVRIHHGLLDSEVNGKKIGMLIIYLEHN